MSPRTLVITNDFPPRAGGIQSFVHSLVERQPTGSVVVYAADWHGAERYDAAQPFPVYRHTRTMMLPDPLVLKRARQLIDQEGCDHVLFGASAPLGLLGPALRRHGITGIVGLTHGHESGWAVTPGAKLLLRRIGDAADTITYLGEYTRSRIAPALSSAAASRMRRLVPGVDTEVFNPRNRAEGLQLRQRLGLADRRVIVCISRLMPRKGQDTLIEALPAIRRDVPDAALLIVGGGPSRQRLERMVANARLRQHVVITGSVPADQIPVHYAAGDVFAMPCRTRERGLDVEGLGMVYLEASATGLAVVAGDSGGAPDAVLRGETGLVVAGGSVAQTAVATSRLLGDQALATKFGQAGRAWVQSQWQWSTTARRLSDLLAGRDPDRADSTQK